MNHYTFSRHIFLNYSTWDPGRSSLGPPEVLEALFDCIDWGVWQLIFTAELERSFEGSIDVCLDAVWSFGTNKLSGEEPIAVASIELGNRYVVSSALSPCDNEPGDGCTFSRLPNKWALLDGRDEYW